MAIRIGRIDKLGLAQEDQQSSLLAAIARSAEELTSGKGWPEGVIDLMADLGRITRVSRVWIFQVIELTDDYIVQDYPFEWADAEEHVQLRLPRFNLFRKDLRTASPEYMDVLASRQRGEWQSVIVSQMEEGEFKDDLESQGILSMLTIPIIVEGKWWGILGFDDCARAYEWNEGEIALLRTATYLLSNAILRDRLSSRTKQFEILKGITESSAWEMDLHNGYVWCSPEIFTPYDGLTSNIHMSLREVLRRIHPQDRRGLFAKLRRHVVQKAHSFRKDLRIATYDGEYVWVEVIAKISLDECGKLRKLAGIAIEILQRKKEEENLRRKADKDALTGVSNRGSFNRQLGLLVQQFNTGQKFFTLLLLDLDYFKRVNDLWGHSTGDAALQHVAGLCQRNLRPTDTLARVGGEEFAILLPGIDEDDARNVAERIRKDIEVTPLRTKGRPVELTVSIGVAGLSAASHWCSRPQCSSDSLYERADKALYVAKKRGRNSLVASSELDWNCTLPEG